MKKTIVLVAIAMMAGFTAKAQVDRNALGLRIGGGSVSGAEISYQLGFSDSNRLELGLGFGGNSNYNRIGMAGVYQWVWPIGGQGFNWYVGPGAGITLNNGKHDHDDYVGVAIGGQIGVGYNFNIPLQLTIDARPMFDFIEESDGFDWGLALGIRYRF